MGSLTGKKSSLERRLKELKKESELVRDDIKVLSKAVKNPDEVNSLPRLKSLRHEERRVPPPTRKDPVSAPREPPPTRAQTRERRAANCSTGCRGPSRWIVRRPACLPR